jgi:hypothetical protein
MSTLILIIKPPKSLAEYNSKHQQQFVEFTQDAATHVFDYYSSLKPVGIIKITNPSLKY